MWEHRGRVGAEGELSISEGSSGSQEPAGGVERADLGDGKELENTYLT